ncbi:MAG: leucine-rich repeat domain-containing protein [Methanobrevibacter sp.]|nr:leucine-rich repeat domain-containing protein [Methanobrevibacter sp.]
MIKLGNNDITLKVGSTDVSAAYLGSVLVYNPVPPEPKWVATYTGGTTSSAECDASSAITQNEITKTNLQSVEIGQCVTSIGDRAFTSCTGLTSVTIGNSVTSIGNEAFYRCPLTSVTIPNSITTIGSNAFFQCNGLASITIPDSVTSIGDQAFSFCSGLTSVTIGSGVTTIGDYVFQGSSLTSVTIPDSVTSIGQSAFASCLSLTSATIPNSVTTIGEMAFGFCWGLTSVTIPDSVTSIEQYAFFKCSGLTSVTVLATTPPTLGTNAFNDTGNSPIYVPAASVSAYQSAWSTYASRIQAIPTPSPQWVDYASGEIIPTDLDIYGVSGTSASLCNTFSFNDNTIYIYLERNAVIADIGPGCYSGSYPMSGDIEITFSDVVDAGCSDSYRLNNAINVATGVKLLIYQ